MTPDTWKPCNVTSGGLDLFPDTIRTEVTQVFKGSYLSLEQFNVPYRCIWTPVVMYESQGCVFGFRRSCCGSKLIIHGAVHKPQLTRIPSKQLQQVGTKI